jgi:hypothetical protein
MNVKNTLLEPMINRGKILSKSEIIAIINEYEKRFKDKKEKNFLKYLSRQKYIRRIFLGLYYINSFDERSREFLEFEDKEIVFMALNKLGVKWYLGLGSSLYLQGKKWQTPNQISIVNTKFSGIKKIMGLKVKFFKTRENLIFGLKRMSTKHNIGYFYSDPAKTNIDRVYFKETDSLIKVKNTKKYLEKYPKWVGKK